jgi:hypothetical protein
VAFAVSPEAEMAMCWVVRACWEVMWWRLLRGRRISLWFWGVYWDTSDDSILSFRVCGQPQSRDAGTYRFDMVEMTASRPCMSPPGKGYLASTSCVRTSERMERSFVSRAKQYRARTFWIAM